MRITGSDGKMALPSIESIKYDKDTLMSAAAAYPQPVQPDENTLLFAAGITGGTALWTEDITGLNRLRAEIEASVRKLVAAKAVLNEEEKIKRAVAEESEKIRIMTLLEDAISRHIDQLLLMIERIDSAADQPKEAARAALLLCYLKRRCNMFYREQETSKLSPEETKYYTAIYIDELAEIAAQIGIKVVYTGEIKTALTARRATVFYDLCYQVIDMGVKQGWPGILVQWENKNGCIIMRLLLPSGASAFTVDTALSEAIRTASGTYVLQDLDDTVGISLSFLEEGQANV
jgi:hypothetical protein